LGSPSQVVKESEEFELLRRMELERAHRRKRRDWEQRVRVERARWKVKDVRRSVMRRNRHDLARIEEQIRAPLALKLASTVTYAKSKKLRNQIKEEVIAEDRRLRNERLQSSEVQEQGAKAMRDTYDAVVSGCLGLLKTATHELRRPTAQGGARQGRTASSSSVSQSVVGPLRTRASPRRWRCPAPRETERNRPTARPADRRPTRAPHASRRRAAASGDEIVEREHRRRR
jgi:hypothetical protein